MLCVITGYEIIGCVAFEMASPCVVSIVRPIEAAACDQNPNQVYYRFHSDSKILLHNSPGAVSVGVSVICEAPSCNCDAPIG